MQDEIRCRCANNILDKKAIQEEEKYYHIIDLLWLSKTDQTKKAACELDSESQ